MDVGSVIILPEPSGPGGGLPSTVSRGIGGEDIAVLRRGIEAQAGHLDGAVHIELLRGLRDTNAQAVAEVSIPHEVAAIAGRAAADAEHGLPVTGRGVVKAAHAGALRTHCGSHNPCAAARQTGIDTLDAIASAGEDAAVHPRDRTVGR